MRRLPLFVALLLILAACALAEPRLWTAVAATLRIAVGTVLLAAPLGIFFATVFVKTNLPGRALGPVMLAMLLLTPLHVPTAGWETIAGKLGWWTFGHGGVDRALLAGEAAVIWIHTLAAWPWIALLVAVGFSTVDAASEDAARMTLPSWAVLGTVTLPHIAPFVLLAALWTAVSVAGEMTVANIYFLRTYADEIYTQFALESSPAVAWRSMAPGMCLLAAGLALSLALLPRGGSAWSFTRPTAFEFASRWSRRVTAIFTWTLLTALLAVPLVGLVHRAGVEVSVREQKRERQWSATKAARIVAESPRKYGPEFRDTLRIAAAAASLSVLLLLPPLFAAHNAGRTLGAAWLLAIPALVPGPLVGMTLIQLLNRPELPWLADQYQRTSLAPILAVMTRAAPIAGWILLAAFAATPRDTLDAARLLGRSFAGRLLMLVRGCWLPAVGAAWLAAFAVAAGDLSASILVLPPGVYPIAFRIFGLLHAGADDQVAGMCLTLIAATFVGGLLVRAGLAPLMRQRG